MTSLTLPRSRSDLGVAFHQAGDHGAPLVLVHGVGLRAESWFQQIEALRADYRIYAVDMPGHGHSRRLDDAAPSLDHFTDRLAGFVRAVIGEPVIVAGHSMGALVALDLAARHGDLCMGVAALNAVYGRSAEACEAILERADSLQGATGEDMASAPVKRWFGDNPKGHERAMAAHCRGWLDDADRRGYADAYRIFAASDGPSCLAALAVPALFLTGDGDLNSTASMTEAMALIAPRARAVVIKGARHMVQMTHPQAVNAALAEFCETCTRAAGE